MSGVLTYGIDVSHYSEAINWDTVLAQNVHFVFAKASEVSFTTHGVSKFKDPMFDTYWPALGSRNVKRGAFHFCRPGIDPDLAMSFFFTVYTLKTGDLLPTLDVEDQYADDTSVSAQDKVTQIQKMVSLVSAKINGQKPIIYTKRRVWKALNNPGDIGGCPLWVIDYNGNDTPVLPASWSKFSFWQYAENKSMPGIQGDFDPDYFNGAPNDLAACCIQ